MITVYSQPGCMPCRATKRKLNDLHLEYKEVDVSTNPDAKAHIEALGYISTPVVETDNEHWGGFKIDKVNALVTSS